MLRRCVNLKQHTIISLLVFGWMVSALPVAACELCPDDELLTLAETVAQADLIVIAQKIGDEDGRVTVPDPDGGPEWSTLQIREVLRGTASQPEIIVNSWEGMCSYGIIVGDQPVLLLLEESSSADEPYQYDAVARGCGEKGYLVTNDSINLNGTVLSIDQFIAQYVPNGQRTILSSGQSNVIFVLGATVVVTVLLGVVTVIIVFMRLKRNSKS